jgi:peroxiredoxin
MPAQQPPVCNFGWKAVHFRLPATDGRTYALADVAGPKGTLVMFICNHCPYVKASIARIVEDASMLQQEGVGVAAIMSNDTRAYPEDSFEKMQLFAAKHNFTFPYLIDETQEAARAYDAICTPDFFGFNAALELQYRGRLDAARLEPAGGMRRDLLEAMRLIAATGKGPAEQVPSMGCSIKWRHAA